MRIFVFLLSLFFVGQVMAFSPSDLRSIGKGVPAKLYVFTSLACTHCSGFHKKILPTLKEKYADSGKAQIILVDMVRGENNLIATQIVRCLGMGKSAQLEDVLYTHQSEWAFKEPEEGKKNILSYAKQHGMTQAQFNRCVSDKELRETILDQQENLARLYGITGTPTLVMRDGSEVHKWVGPDETVFEELKEAFQK